MTYGIFWVLFSVAAGVYASNRGRSGIAWFVLSLLISSLLGLIFLAVMKDLSQSNASGAQPGATTHVKCPACAEFVLPEARVCKHCRATLVPAINHQQKTATNGAPSRSQRQHQPDYGRSLYRGSVCRCGDDQPVLM